MFLRIFSLMCFLRISLAVTKCVRAHGQVLCNTDKHRHQEVQITLMDKDGLPWESDDQMGRTWTDKEGHFTVEGCGNDFGPWNEPDPYLIIEHRCPKEGHTVAITHRKTYVPVWRTFLPLETRVGIVRIDQNQEG